ncbi:MAG: hypothetical protein ACLGPM_08740 [Acidobacteriota bacterium]
MLLPTSALLHESNRVGVGFLLTQLQLGSTFLDLASGEQTPEGQSRYLDRARELHDRVRRLMPRVTLTPVEQVHIERDLATLARALLAAGCEIFS